MKCMDTGQRGGREGEREGGREGRRVGKREGGREERKDGEESVGCYHPHESSCKIFI